MRAWDGFHNHSTLGQLTPAEILDQGTEHRLAPCAEQRDMAAVRLLHVLGQRSQMALPKLKFVLGEKSRIDDLFQIDGITGRAALESAPQLSSDRASFSQHEPHSNSG